MKYLSWNCRGVGKTTTRRRLKNFCQTYSPDFIFLQETKCNEAKIKCLASFLNFSNFVCIDADGRSGGLAVFWSAQLGFDVLSISKYWIHGVVSLPYDCKCLVTNVYGPPQNMQ